MQNQLLGDIMRNTQWLALALATGVLGACGSEPGTSSSSVTSTSSSSVSSSSSAASQGSVDLFTDLPDEFRISSDGEMLERGGFFAAKFYDESIVETLYIDFPQGDFRNLLTQNYTSKTPIAATVRYKDKILENVGVRYRGFTSYSQAGNKKSMKVELDWQVEGQDLNGYNTLKLNNAFGDPSNMREVLYSNLARQNIPSARANFMKVVVNGENYGVFANVQQLNKDHVKEWFLDKDATRWRAEAPPGSSTGGFGGFGGGGGAGGFGAFFGAGTSSLNDLGEAGSAYENAYTLKSADIVDPWQDLANAAHTMGVISPQYLVEELGQYLDIDAALWHIATENVFTDDDSYIYKGGMDYYVYFDVATGRILPIEYDGNSAMEHSFVRSWGPFFNADSTAYPLMNILLNVPELRQRYLAHYRTLMSEVLNPSVADAKIDTYVNLITPFINEQSSVRAYSVSQFQTDVNSLKNFFEERHNYLSSNNEVAMTGLTIGDVKDAVNGQVSVRPTANQTVQVSARINGNTGVRAANLYYGTGLMGRFAKVAMTDSNNDGVFEGTIPAQARGEYVRYYVEAIANNSAGTASFMPKGAEHDVYIYQVQAAQKVDSIIVINEIMPSNKTVATDEEGDYGDWIELYNNSDRPAFLDGYYLTDEDIRLDRWAFPAGTSIPARGTLIVWADDKEELTTGLHTNFKLGASGEHLYLVSPDMNFADQVTYVDAPEDASYARLPNGSGDFVWSDNPTFDQTNQ